MSPASRKSLRPRSRPRATGLQRTSSGPTAEEAGTLHQAVDDPRHASPANILALQRTIGNQAVQRLLNEQHRSPITPQPQNNGAGTSIQRKLIDDRPGGTKEAFKSLDDVKAALGQKLGILTRDEQNDLELYFVDSYDHPFSVLLSAFSKSRGGPRPMDLGARVKDRPEKMKKAIESPGTFVEAAKLDFEREGDQTQANKDSAKMAKHKKKLGLTPTDEEKEHKKQKESDKNQDNVEKALAVTKGGGQGGGYGTMGIGNMVERGTGNTSVTGDEIGAFSALAVTNIVNTGEDITRAGHALYQLRDAQGIKHNQAIRTVMQSSWNAVSDSTATARTALNIANNAGASEVGAVIPGLGIAVSGLDAVEQGVKLTAASIRIYHYRNLRSEWKHQMEKGASGKLETLIAIVDSFIEIDEAQIAACTARLVADTTKIVGNGLTLGGITAIAGVPITAIGTIISLGTSAAEKGHELNQAHKNNKAEKVYGNPLKEISYNPHLAAQIVLHMARKEKERLQVGEMLNEQDHPALLLLGAFDIKPKKLGNSTDEDLREYMLTALGKSNKTPETLTQQVRDVKEKMRDKGEEYHIVKPELADGENRLQELQNLAEVRNLLKYSGKTDRDPIKWAKENKYKDIEQEKRTLLMTVRSLTTDEIQHLGLTPEELAKIKKLLHAYESTVTFSARPMTNARETGHVGFANASDKKGKSYKEQGEVKKKKDAIVKK